MDFNGFTSKCRALRVKPLKQSCQRTNILIQAHALIGGGDDDDDDDDDTNQMVGPPNRIFGVNCGISLSTVVVPLAPFV